MTLIPLSPSVHPGSGIKFRTTEVYTGSLEVKMVATKDIDAPMYLTRCAGAMAKVTGQPDIDDDCRWIINRCGQYYVLLGPIRFFNVSCNNRAYATWFTKEL
jgi:hypothetical protein